MNEESLVRAFIVGLLVGTLASLMPVAAYAPRVPHGKRTVEMGPMLFIDRLSELPSGSKKRTTEFRDLDLVNDPAITPVRYEYVLDPPSERDSRQKGSK